MKDAICIATTVFALFGCTAFEPTETGHLTGEVVQYTDTSVRIHLRQGPRGSYYLVDVTYQGDLARKVENLRLTSATASLGYMIGGDALMPFELNEDFSRITFGLNENQSRMCGDVVAVGSLADGEPPVWISGSFDIPAIVGL
jgi:hypothetical protein